MNEAVSTWLEFGKKDLQSAKALFKAKLYETAIWHCHQTIEKMLKLTESTIKWLLFHNKQLP